MHSLKFFVPVAEIRSFLSDFPCQTYELSQKTLRLGVVHHYFAVSVEIDEMREIEDLINYYLEYMSHLDKLGFYFYENDGRYVHVHFNGSC